MYKAWELFKHSVEQGVSHLGRRTSTVVHEVCVIITMVTGHSVSVHLLHRSC